jgi:hypothetical protein
MVERFSWPSSLRQFESQLKENGYSCATFDKSHFELSIQYIQCKYGSVRLLQVIKKPSVSSPPPVTLDTIVPPGSIPSILDHDQSSLEHDINYWKSFSDHTLWNNYSGRSDGLHRFLSYR